ncbi:Arachidonate 5-lipoxygenase [Triplophysa tibetana]|uniref:Arachidonate 5-lipoxygenase n=1 Tax=Triplophysa tibetana TaxID=1572043 RepID=A0A5A9NSW4_9TELE|nr:Arachidonate 5-lipoxygenase [Triplophysa tibetana]
MCADPEPLVDHEVQMQSMSIQSMSLPFFSKTATEQYKVLVSYNGDVSHFSLTLVDLKNKSIETTWEKGYSWTKEKRVPSGLPEPGARACCLADPVRPPYEHLDSAHTFLGGRHMGGIARSARAVVGLSVRPAPSRPLPHLVLFRREDVPLGGGLLILNMSGVHIAPKCGTALPWVQSDTPATCEVDRMNGFRHNKYANGQTRIRSAPSLQIFQYSVFITTECMKLKKMEINITVDVEKDLGDIVEVKIKKDDAPWFCRYVKVKSPSGKSFEFPCYSWLEKKEVVIREGSVNVIEDWNTDYMFGYQFLNGCNPVMIRKCVTLPKTFPVTHEMVEGSLQRGLTLQEELKKGNIYIADYEILDGLDENKIKNTQLYLTAPICLLYNNRLDQIVPIAIQLSQKPGKSSPIFLPNDNDCDWMLAKMWVKSSDFIVHQLVTHLLKTHLISEVFEVAMYRHLSPVHPVYKLLMPHVRFTIAINAAAREKLISEDGVFSKISSISASGMDELMKRAMETFTYKSMCFPEAINARGMENTPKYYYRDDGMKIWEAIYSFVDQVIKIYYDSDEKVQKDVEIQHFVKNVNFGMEDFISDRKDPEGKKFPRSLKTREELVEYLTAVIFNASAQHAAVNFGQFEWYGWIPNSPSTMRKPPPREKDSVDLNYIMDTLPDRGCSYEVLGMVWALSRFQENEV